MDHFLYRDGALFAEDVAVAEIAAAVGTPFYCYSAATLERHYRLFDEALEASSIWFAMPSSGVEPGHSEASGRFGRWDGCGLGRGICACARRWCAGRADCFSGVGKTEAEMRMALEGGIRQFNVESEPELERLNAVALSLGVKAPITLRVNPDVDAKTHAKIATGKSENKFGIPIAKARAFMPKRRQWKVWRLSGLMCISARN